MSWTHLIFGNLLNAPCATFFGYLTKSPDRGCFAG